LKLLRPSLPTLAAVLAFGCSGRGLEPVNIVFISIDSLRADHIGAYGYSRETSPTLDRLAAEGALFENAVALYDGEILFTDQHIASVIEAIESRGLASNTLVVVTSDHGDEFFEHGGKGHGQTLYDEVLRVPLIVRLPGRIPAGLRVREQVRHLDIAPTLLSFAGIDARLRGHDLGRRLTGGEEVPTLEALSTLRRNGDWFSYRTPGFKYLVHREGSQEEEFLFDLDRDSGEEQPLVRTGETSATGREAEVLARLREGLRKEESVGRARGSGRQERMEVPSDVLEQLRSLGYVEKP